MHYFTKVGSGETFGGEEEDPGFIDDEYEDDDYVYDEEEDWEDLEEWKADPPISVSHKWSSLPYCPPPPRHIPNNINHRYSTNTKLLDILG